MSPEEVAAGYFGMWDCNGDARPLVERVVGVDSRFCWEEGLLRVADPALLGLREATYVVLDLETTGSSAKEGGITEVGAVKIEEGEISDTFSTLINPGMPIQTYVAKLTGITDKMVADAPPFEDVLPSLEKFMEGAVLVGHNVSFDLSFLAAGGKNSENPALDTLRLARILVPGLRRYKLSALARHFGAHDHPNHRALSDAAATAHIFLELVERMLLCGVASVGEAGSLKRGGVKFRDKLHLMEGVPASPGVYYFLNDRDEVLYVGKAKDLKSRVRSYFTSPDGRRKIPRLLRETARVQTEETESELGALILEAREITRLEPPYNTAGRHEGREWYLCLDTREDYPVPYRCSEPSGEGGVLSFGPYRGAAMLDACAGALERILPVRRCEEGSTRPCFYGQMGRCGPCMGMSGEEYHREVVGEIAALLRGEGECHLRVLAGERDRLAAELEFEAAARLRDLIRNVERLRMARAATEHGGLRAFVASSTEPGVAELFVLRGGALIGHSGFPDGDEEGLLQFARRMCGAECENGSDRGEAAIVAAYIRRRAREVEEVPLEDEKRLLEAVRRVCEGGEISDRVIQ